MSRLSFPKNRNYWISFALFAFVILTGVLLLLNWYEASRIEIFRGIIQMVLFTFWGFDRYAKYRTQMTKAERPEDNEAPT
jgi:hypothetical protein